MPISRGGACLVSFLITTLGLSTPLVRADEPVKDNIEVMKLVTTQAIEEILARFPPHLETPRLVLAPYAKDEVYDFMTNVFSQTLTERGYKTFTAGRAKGQDQNTQGQKLRLEYHALDFGLRYPKIYRSYLIGGKVVERRAKVKIVAKLLDPSDDSIVWIGESEKTYEDDFPFSMIDEVEAGKFEWVKPPRKNTNWGKLVEPVVVSAIIVGLIYLFFSNQSGE